DGIRDRNVTGVQTCALPILTPFGARVHAPWALALSARLRESLGLEVQSIWSDDGIAIHLPDADAPPPTDEIIIAPDLLEELVVISEERRVGKECGSRGVPGG